MLLQRAQLELIFQLVYEIRENLDKAYPITPLWNI